MADFPIQKQQYGLVLGHMNYQRAKDIKQLERISYSSHGFECNYDSPLRWTIDRVQIILPCSSSGSLSMLQQSCKKV